MRTKLPWQKILAFVLVAAFVIGVAPVQRAWADAGDSVLIESQQPAGDYENLSLNKPVEASSDATWYQHNAALTGTMYDWQKEWLCDGDMGAGWSTAYDEGVTDPATPAWATVDLEENARLRRIVLYPTHNADYAQNFPKALELRISQDNTSWTTVYTASDIGVSVSAPLVIDLTDIPIARYVQVYVTQRTDSVHADETDTTAYNTLPVQIGELVVFGTTTLALADNVASYQPKGCISLTAGKTATVSSGATDAALLTDEQADALWTSEVGDTAPEISLDFGVLHAVKRIVLFSYGEPYGAGFPQNYTLEASENGVDWTALQTVTAGGTPIEPVVLDVAAPVVARYIRLRASGEAIALSELAVFGQALGVSLDRPALELVCGETDKLSVKLNNTAADPAAYDWSSSDTSVVTVGADGTVTAAAAGSADITVSLKGQSEASTVCHIYVVTERRDIFNENVIISMFWPPIGPDYIVEEQYKLLADAGINYVMGAGENVDATADQLKMLEWCYKYGMRMTVGDGRLGPDLVSRSREEIAAILADYKNVPGVGGYWLIDEPGNPNDYLNAYQTLKSLEPDKYVYLNFLPGRSEGQINDWLKLNAAAGHPCDYYLYDLYPFAESGTATGAMLQNLATGWRAGAANDVKTGTFIQSVGISGHLRVPNKDEIRWETNIALAYGYKYLSYFTWFLPPTTGEPFHDSIITRDGKKTPLYDAVSDINHQILSIGSTLIKLDAKAVYFNGETYGGIVGAVPSTFFAKPQDNVNYQVSLMRHRTTGRNYLMIVNNSFTDRASFALKLPSEVASLELIGACDAGTQGYTYKNGVLTIDADIGGAYLFALPEGLDYVDKAAEPGATDNLAPYAKVYASSSEGNGFYVGDVNDGVRTTTDASMGWRSTGADKEPWIKFDLGAKRPFNRIDLYPTELSGDFGSEMPSDFVIEVSDDGLTWQTAHTVSGYVQKDRMPPSFSFDTVNGRWVRIRFTGLNASVVSIAEIEIYNDDGTVPPPKEIPVVIDYSNIYTYKPENTTLLSDNTPVEASSHVKWFELNAAQTGTLFDWQKEWLCDVDAHAGWSTDPEEAGPEGGEYDETLPAWAYTDLGELCRIRRVALFPCDSPYGNNFPQDFRIEVSDDGDTWRTVKTVTGAASPATEPYIIDFDSYVLGRYVRLYVTRRTSEVNGNNGPMVQLAEMAVFGLTGAPDPVDKDELMDAVDKAGNKNTDSFTEDSVKNFNDALDEAKRVLDDPDATEEDVQQALNALNAATAGLKPRQNSEPEQQSSDSETEIGYVVKGNAPNTGERFGVWLCGALLLLSAGVFAFVMIYRRRRSS